MPRRRSRIHSTEDARRLARRRLPRLVFDFIDGAAGREAGAARNRARFDEIMLLPRVMADIAGRDLSTRFLGQAFDAPFGIAPMGMCNLAHPRADRLLAEAARKTGFALCLSSAASTAMEDMRDWGGAHVWFQLYFRQSREATLATVARAEAAGYETLVLTVDVPEPSRRIRDLRNGFDVPFRMSMRAFMDFATHPRWSLATLAAGPPKPRNFDADAQFERRASRAGADWGFLARLRERWRGRLIVKGVCAPEDALRIQSMGADAIYVSNHGARQLDSAPPAIDLLAPIRAAVGPDYPLLFDGGARNGEDVVKALALGANLVMLGRAPLYALGAEGARGLDALLGDLIRDIGIAMAQLGVRTIPEIGPHLVHAQGRAPAPDRAARLHVALQS